MQSFQIQIRYIAQDVTCNLLRNDIDGANAKRSPADLHSCEKEVNNTNGPCCI